MEKIITKANKEVLEITEENVRRVDKDELKREIENWDIIINKLQTELDYAKNQKAIARNRLSLFKNNS